MRRPERKSRTMRILSSAWFVYGIAAHAWLAYTLYYLAFGPVLK